MSPPELAAALPRARPFEYTAVRADGTEVQGRTTAASELELDRLLESDGLTLITARQGQAGTGLESLRMKRRELVAFTNQLATMIHAGVPLLQSLRHLAEHSRTKESRVIVQSILRQIEAGSSLSESLETHKRVFPETYVAMVRSGEMSATLPEVLQRQAKFLDWVREVKAITKQALIYPCALMLAIVALVVILITFLIPRLVGMFPGGHEDLPAQTKFVLAISDFLRGNWPYLTGGLVITGVAYAGMLRVERTRILLSGWLLRIPRLGNLMSMLAVARFSTTAAALHKSGCDIVQTLTVAGDSCGSSFLRARFTQVIDSVRGGAPISEAMDSAGNLDPFLIQLTSIGETSGRLGECLEHIAESYNAEIPRMVKWALGLIEPLVLIVGGVLVAFLLLAAILPIFKIYETLG